MNSKNVDDAPRDLVDLVRRHQVRFEVLPLQAIVEEGRRTVGFSLHLYGVHEPPHGETPGCPACVQIYGDLASVARWVIPADKRPSRHDIRPFDRALHVTPEDAGRDEVRLELRIVHRSDADAPLDECQERCIAEMRARLKLVGAREGARRLLR